MFNHFERSHQIKAATREILDRLVAIIDSQPLRLGMRPRYGDIFRCGIEARYLRAEPREWLAKQAGAAADIERCFAVKRLQQAGVAMEMQINRIPYIAQPHRIQPVQHG